MNSQLSSEPDADCPFEDRPSPVMLVVHTMLLPVYITLVASYMVLSRARSLVPLRRE